MNLDLDKNALRRPSAGRERAAEVGAHAGFTLVEVTIILTVLSVLSLILLPSIGGYVRDARLARARLDVVTISKSIHKFLEDTGEAAFRCFGNGNRETSEGRRSDPANTDPFFTVEMLISDGDTPDRGDEEDSWMWRRSYDGHIVDTLANHLVSNTPGDDASAYYRTPEDLVVRSGAPQYAFASQAGMGARLAWRGPYLSAPVRSDPWGNRFAVNVLYLDPGSDSATGDGSGWTFDVFVMSAGPDEQVDTPYRIDGVVPGDDDVVAVLSGGSR